MSAMTSELNLTPAARRILEVASRLFYENGIRAVGVDLIAREAGVTKKTIYDRFGSKDALVRAYLDTRTQFWNELIASRVERDEFGPRERLLAMFDILDEQMRDRGCAFINAHAESSEQELAAYSITRDQKIWLKSYFSDLASQAGFVDPDALATQLLMLHEGAFIAYAMAGERSAASSARAAAEVLIDSATRDWRQ
jgi:AcrR family transcriptional regulator